MQEKFNKGDEVRDKYLQKQGRIKKDLFKQLKTYREYLEDKYDKNYDDFARAYNKRYLLTNLLELTFMSIMVLPIYKNILHKL